MKISNLIENILKFAFYIAFVLSILAITSKIYHKESVQWLNVTKCEIKTQNVNSGNQPEQTQ